MTPQPGFAPHVAHLGTGARQVLALHCTLAFSGAWAGLMRHMGREVTFVAPDMPSHGRSPDWDGESSFADTVFTAALSCLTQPMDVVGHSFGGATALWLAVERPDLVRSLTLIEPVFFCIARQDDPAATEAHTQKSLPFYTHVQNGEMEEAARTFNRMWSSGPRWQDMPEQVRAAMTRAIPVVPDTHGFLFDDTADLLPRLTRAAMPTLLIRGAETDNIIAATNTGLAQRLPNAEEHVISGAGHMAPITHPGPVADLLRPLWARSEMREELEHPFR